MLNSICLQGRFTDNPVLRYTQTQTPVVSFALASDSDFADQNGERKCEFIQCVAWKGTAEFISKYFQKGQMALVSGRLQQRDYTDREGINRRVAEIVVSSINFCGKKEDNQNNGGSYQPQQQRNYQPQNVYAPDDFEELDEEGDGEPPF